MSELASKTLKALNSHLCAELAASHRYLAASAYFTDSGYDGMAGWMRIQATEEHGHAMKFFDHILARNGEIELAEVPKPPAKYKSPLDAFEQALALEQKTTERIHRLYADALKEGDYPLQIFLQWFIQEQVDEEKAARHAVDRLRLAGSDAAALLVLDQELGQRGSGA